MSPGVRTGRAMQVAEDLLTLGVRTHAVQFYEDEAYLTKTVVGYLSEGLARGDACIAIATGPHSSSFRDGLAGLGFGVSELVGSNRLTLLDAQETLASFMVNAQPDAERFHATMGAALDRCQKASSSGRIRAYGEMVDLLWADTKGTAALQLERLWNDLATTHSFALLCGYALHQFRTISDSRGFGMVCDVHTHVVPTEQYGGVDEDDARRREIAHLQQRALALETEVAKREQTERELKAREEDLRDFVENAAVGLHWVDSEGRILWANRAELDLLGYSRDEYIGRHIRDFHVDAPVIEDILGRLHRKETLKEYEARVRHKDGSVRYVLIDSNVRWRDGEFLHTRCFSRDITDRKRTFDALSHLHQTTELLAAATTLDDVLDVLISEGLAVTGASGGAVSLVNRENQTLDVLRTRGYPAAVVELNQRLPLAMRTPITDCVRHERAIYVESGAGPYDGEHADVYAIGSEARAAIPMVASRRVIGALKFSFDDQHVFDDHEKVFLDALAKQGAQALERARLYDSERVARKESERANRRKDEFLALLGHELRNPLAPIRTALELTRLRGTMGHREREVMERQVEHLSRLVDDLLDVSRITRGKVALDRRPIETAAIIAKAIEMASPLFEQRQHELSCSVPASGLLVSADEFRLAQVVCNLLTNAAKFTAPGGHIAVDARREGVHVLLSVRDDGIGMTPQLMGHVFEPFVQGERQGDRQHSGLGLGLALARNLTELHGGSIAVHSEGIGHGTTFTLKLPILRDIDVSAAARCVEAAIPSRKLRILVIDDNPDAAELVAELLSAVGHEVTIAHDGPSALAKVVAFKPDAALVDIGLPVMDGFEIAGRLRELLGPQVRLVAVTGFGMESDKANTRAAGFDDHLVKPVSMDALMKSLASVN